MDRQVPRLADPRTQRAAAQHPLGEVRREDKRLQSGRIGALARAANETGRRGSGADVINFRPLAAGDLPLVAEWLQAEHVRRWWRDPPDIQAVRAKYLPRINGKEPTEVFVVSVTRTSSDSAPVGIIQRCRFADYGTWADTVAGTDLAYPNAAGIDYFIGPHERTGRGVGSAMIRAFSDKLFVDCPDVETIVVTPQNSNRASCRALETADYSHVWTGTLDSDDPSDAGPSAIYVRHR